MFPKKKEWQVDQQSYSPDHIDLIVTTEDEIKWRLTGIYGHPNRGLRHHSWELLNRLKSLSSMSSIVRGDFNEIDHFSEKMVRSERNHASMESFRNVSDQCNFMALGYDGLPFT